MEVVYENDNHEIDLSKLPKERPPFDPEAEKRLIRRIEELKRSILERRKGSHIYHF